MKAKRTNVYKSGHVNYNELDTMRHSAAHLMAAAVKNLWPETKFGIGPTTENGFYYDFELPVKISDTDFPKIEHEMLRLQKAQIPFIKSIVSIKKALGDAKQEKQTYKQELLKQLEKSETEVSIYTMDNFSDLCKGPHVATTGDIGVCKLLSIAGAYWKGDEHNTMLTRIYGTAFATQKELDQYIWQLEEAKKRDHRKIGESLDLFTISEDVGRGLILWLPKGNIIKETLENFAKQTEETWGYQRVTTPNITKSNLYYTSGHLPYYKSDMYPPMKLDDGEEYFLKPMNCPHHHMIFKARPRSYRDLPIRLAEYGTCYRYEASGELFGLMRVRGFSQNDAHIYCTLEQAVDEFLTVMKLHEYYYNLLGIKEYHLELSLRDPKDTKKYHGDEGMWHLAEKLMREAAAKTNIPMVEKLGGAAFYGPKIDFIIHSSIGREFAISTNQIDLFMAKRFGLEYTDEQGKRQTPVIIHRAPLGSHERFIGFLIEHYAGAFPVWLSPVQVQVIPITERQQEAALKVKQALSASGIRAEIDEKSVPMGAKIREATLHKIPYMAIIGDREMAANTVSVRTRSGEDLKAMSLSDFIQRLTQDIEHKL